MIKMSEKIGHRIRRRRAFYALTLALLVITAGVAVYSVLSGNDLADLTTDNRGIFAVFRFGVYFALILLFIAKAASHAPNMPKAVLRSRIYHIIFYLVVFELVVAQNAIGFLLSILTRTPL